MGLPITLQQQSRNPFDGESSTFDTAIETETTMKCPQCQTDNQADSRFCLNCGTALTPPLVVDEGIRGRPLSVEKRYAQGKDPIVATILSFFIPGVGQFYNGDALKGVVMLVGAIVLSFTVLGTIAIWVWSMVDAYQVAKGQRSLWS
jgi:TM2 domain-containing membrane protein YozV